MTTTDPLIGKTLGDYNIESILGTGGMARVYKGLDTNLERYAAIKVVEPQLVASTDEAEYRERFLREARAIARLSHPNIVSIYQYNQVGNLYYIAMEYAPGDNLRDVLKSYIQQGRVMPTDELLVVLQNIADALDYAHKQNIIHRDVKPSNIIVNEEGRAVLTDFGLALNAMEGTVGNTFGSVHYIAPEQAISSAQSVAQSDQYSLGIVAYELLTGRVPFDDASAMSVALKHISDP
ncbi:MAG: serine/threonine-protein kinase, partial [Chloroflexota bacterium]